MEYLPPPTVEAFMRDNHRIRVIVGPLGCLPAETEVLTEHGWVPIGNWKGQRIAQWHTDNTIEFVTPSEYLKLPCDRMWRFYTGPGSVNMVLSDEHRVPHYDYRGKFIEKTAGEIVISPSKRTIPTTFIGPDGPGLDMSDDLIRFAVMMHADGHYPAHGYQARIVVRKERKKKRIREILTRLGLDWTEAPRADAPQETRFTFYPPYHGKHFSPKWYSANRHQLQIILDEADHWDGMPNHAERRYFSTYKTDADFIQYAAHACGLRATINPNTPRTGENTCYSVRIRTGDNPKNRAMIRCDITQINRTGTSDGYKYCFVVPSSYFVARHDDFIFITGNSGKTMGMIMELVRWACQQKPYNGVRRTRFALVRNTLQQLRQTVLADAMSYLSGVAHYYTTDSTMQLRLNLPDGSHVHSDWALLPLDTKEDVRRLLSTQLTGGWINELREVPIDIIRPLLGRCGRYPSKAMGGCTKRGIIADTNPWDTDSPYHDRLVLNPHPAWKLFHQPSGLSPGAENIENLPEGYYDELMSDKDVDWAAVHVESQWGTSNAGQAVFRKSFHAPTHVRDMKVVVNPSRPVMVGLDFGRTPCAVIGQHDNYGRAIVMKEIVTEGMGLIQMVEEHLKPVLLAPPFAGKRVFIVGDPAGRARSQVTETTPFDDLRDLGLLAYPASSNAIDARLTAVEKAMRSTIMGEPGLQISRDGCPILIQSLGNKYRYRRRRDGQLDDLPEKLHPWSDVCFVAGTPIATLSGPQPVERLTIGDLVLSADGVAEVQATGARQVNTTVEITLTDGRSVRCTPEHPFALDGGWCPAYKLQQGDILQCQINNNSTDGLITNTVKTRITGTKITANLNHCTKQCGNTITALYRRVTKYIIGTMTQLTIPLIIWNWSVTPSTQSITGIPRSAKHLRVSDAVNNTKPTDKRENEDFARRTVKLWRALKVALTTKPAFALSAANHFKSTNTESTLKPAPVVAEVKWVQKNVIVYNIKTSTSTYYANKLLVHNCDSLQYFCLGTHMNLTGRVMLRDRPRVVRDDRELVSAAGWT